MCPIGFKRRLCNRLINRHDKELGVGEGVHIVVSLQSYGLLGRDVTYVYCGTNLPNLRRKLVASSSLVEIYRPLKARSVSCSRYREFVGGTVQISGKNLS